MTSSQRIKVYEHGGMEKMRARVENYMSPSHYPIFYENSNPKTLRKFWTGESILSHQDCCSWW